MTETSHAANEEAALWAILRSPHYHGVGVWRFPLITAVATVAI